MAARDIFLQLRNAANTAFTKFFLTPTVGKQEVIKFVDGVPELVELFDSNGIVRNELLSTSARFIVKIVANQAARFALTTADVQNNDVVWQDDEGKGYYVVDDTQLGVAAGYKYSPAIAFDWANIAGKPLLARKVAVPATSTTAGEVGDYAVDDDYRYDYVGDGTTHKWIQILGTTF